jgi:two-component system sensor histidine kinase HydH
MSPHAHPQDEPHHSTRWARWGMLFVSLAMGVALIATALLVWDDSRSAAKSVGEARTMDLFRAVRRALRDAVLDGTTDLEGLRQEFAEAGLRYVAVFDRDGEVRFEVGKARGKLDPSDMRPRDPGDLRPFAVGDRLRLEAPLAPRPGWRGRGPRLIIEVDPTLARSLEQTAKNQLIVSAVVSLVLIAMVLVFWRLMRRADRLELLRARDRRLAALGSMSAILGHELRNPLASLKGHAQLALEKTPDGERSRKNLERVVAESERLERLTTQILEFTRTEKVDLAPASPSELVRAVVAKADDARVTVSLERAPACWPFDRQRMEQVLTNLIVNAREHTPEGPITISAAQVGDALVFEVADTGPGFTPDEHGRLDWVFEPFQTAGKTYGTGLGLAIAKQIVLAHRGTITADNRGGAVVVIALPSS